MKIKKPLEPNLPGTSEFKPRLARYGRDSDLPALSAIKKILAKKVGRSNSKFSAKGSGRIRPQRGYQQRVVVKARVVKMNSQTAKQNLRAHVQYLVRSGVSRAGESPSFFSNDQANTKKDITEQIKQWGEDRHHFRFIISPEKGRELDLEEYTREIVKGFEKDLGEKLTWFATCHYNTDEPHVHLVVRGVGEDGKTLTIAKEYIRHGLRELTQRVATIRLGERTDSDLKKGLIRDIDSLKWTTLDSIIEREIKHSPDSSIRLYKDTRNHSEVSKIYKEVKLQRLTFLKKHDLSIEVSPGVWKLSNDAEVTLKSVGKIDRVTKLVSKHLEGREALSSLAIYEKGERLDDSIVGEVLGVGYQDKQASKKYILVAGGDGRNHFIEPSRFSIPSGVSIKTGQVVRISNEYKSHMADEVIKKFSDKHGGLFQVKDFEDYVRDSVNQGSWKLPESISMESYLDRFRTRTTSLVESGIIRPNSEGTYTIPKDLLEQVAVLDKKLGSNAYLSIEVESYLSIKQQITYEGATWLDNPSFSKDAPSLSSFGIKVQSALKERKEQFRSRGISEEDQDYVVLSNLDQKRLKDSLREKYGPEIEIKKGENISGTVKKYEILGTGLQEIIKTKDGFIVRKLGSKDSLIPLGSSVTVQRLGGLTKVKVVDTKERGSRGKGKVKR